jgi:hypothetical protein
MREQPDFTGTGAPRRGSAAQPSVSGSTTAAHQTNLELSSMGCHAGGPEGWREGHATAVFASAAYGRSKMVGVVP